MRQSKSRSLVSVAWISHDAVASDRAPLRRPALLPLLAQAVPRPGHRKGLCGGGVGAQHHQEREGRADLKSSNQSTIT